MVLNDLAALYIWFVILWPVSLACIVLESCIVLFALRRMEIRFADRLRHREHDEELRSSDLPLKRWVLFAVVFLANGFAGFAGFAIFSLLPNSVGRGEFLQPWPVLHDVYLLTMFGSPFVVSVLFEWLFIALTYTQFPPRYVLMPVFLANLASYPLFIAGVTLVFQFSDYVTS